MGEVGQITALDMDHCMDQNPKMDNPLRQNPLRLLPNSTHKKDRAEANAKVAELEEQLRTMGVYCLWPKLEG